jgi:DNA-binding MarR family transcriptional regulator
MRTMTALLIALLLAAAPVAAQENVTSELPEDPGDSALDNVVDAVGGAADAVGDAVSATGKGIGKGASALGGAITGMFSALGNGVVAMVAGLAAAGSIVAAGLLTGFASLGTPLTWLGSIGTGGIMATVTGIGDGFLAYIHMVGSMRPDAMPVAVFGAVASVGAAGSAGAGGWGGIQALKKWGMLGTGLAGVGGFSRISNDDLLEHPMRSNIFDVIKTHPGIHASQLARELDVGWGTITHHLDKLSRAQIVTTRRVNNQKCFFEQGGEISRQDMAIASALKGDTASGITDFVQHHPMTSQKNMAEALTISPALASFHVKKLVTLGVLEKVRHGKETLLTTSDGLRRVMASADPITSAAMQQQEVGFEYSS